MIDRKLAEKLLEFLSEYLDFYKSFFKVESEKYDDLVNGKVQTMDKHVKTEEVFMLKSRGLEAERERLIALTGNPKATFRQLIALFEPSLQPKAKKIFDELSQVMLNLKEINLRCNNLTELKLHRIQTDLNRLNHHPELQKVYASKLRDEAVPPSILSKKV